jgi:hypothetical protein
MDINSANNGAMDFPSHLVPASEKNKSWIMQFCRAAWSNWNSSAPRYMFWHGRYKYDEFRQYAMGSQTTSKYKPLMGVDADSNETWLNVNWDIIPILPKFRRIVLSELAKKEYNIVATPIDSMANEQTNKYFADAQAKIIIREQAKSIDPTMLQSPALKLSANEAQDLEELEMQMKYTYKHEMSIEAEQAIKLVFDQNDVKTIRDEVREDIYDYGVGGYKRWIDSNGAIKIRRINPANMLSSMFRRKDLKDATYIGEIIEMTIADLKQVAGNQFNESQYEELAKRSFGQFGNPNEIYTTTSSQYNRSYDKFKIRVMDIEFYSVNNLVYEKKISARGNKVYAPAPETATNGFDENGNLIDKFDRISYKVVYKGKWIINTDMIFDYGLATNMVRAKSSLMDTNMSYHIYAPDFYDMKAYSTIERAIPVADAIQIAWYRLQNAINQSRPKGIMIEMATLEDIPLGAGGKKLTPIKVLDLYNQTGTLVYRKNDSSGKATNYKPIEELENGLGRDVMNYWQIIQNNIQLLRDITGMNELTDGSTPDSKTLTTVAKLAAQGSNNAIYHIEQAEGWLIEQLADSVILSLQDVVKYRDVEGYVRGLGNNTIKFIRANKALSLHEFGIEIEEKPSDEQKQRLIAHLDQYTAQGLVEPEDAVTIENTDNLKVAQQILAYKVKKRKKEQQEQAMQMQQQNGQIQQQSAMSAEQSKQQTLQIEAQVKAMLIDKEKEWDYKIQERMLQFKEMEHGFNLHKAQTKEELSNKGKENVAKINKGIPVSNDSSLPAMPMPTNGAPELLQDQGLMDGQSPLQGGESPDGSQMMGADQQMGPGQMGGPQVGTDQQMEADQQMGTDQMGGTQMNVGQMMQQ